MTGQNTIISKVHAHQGLGRTTYTTQKKKKKKNLHQSSDASPASPELESRTTISHPSGPRANMTICFGGGLSPSRPVTQALCHPGPRITYLFEKELETHRTVDEDLLAQPLFLSCPGIQAHVAGTPNETPSFPVSLN